MHLPYYNIVTERCFHEFVSSLNINFLYWLHNAWDDLGGKEKPVVSRTAENKESASLWRATVKHSQLVHKYVKKNLRAQVGTLYVPIAIGELNHQVS